MRHALLALPLALAAGCGGGGSSDKDQIRSIVEDGTRNPVSICKHLTDRALRGLGGQGRCEALARSPDNQDPGARIARITVRGDKATVLVTGKDGENNIRFVKEEGEWRITTE